MDNPGAVPQPPGEIQQFRFAVALFDSPYYNPSDHVGTVVISWHTIRNDVLSKLVTLKLPRITPQFRAMTAH